jgi:hypothetical protein
MVVGIRRGAHYAATHYGGWAFEQETYGALERGGLRNDGQCELRASMESWNYGGWNKRLWDVEKDSQLRRGRKIRAEWIAVWAIGGTLSLKASEI